MQTASVQMQPVNIDVKSLDTIVQSMQWRPTPWDMRYIATLLDGTKIVCKRPRAAEGEEWAEWQCFTPDHDHPVANAQQVLDELEELWNSRFASQSGWFGVQRQQ